MKNQYNYNKKLTFAASPLNREGNIRSDPAQIKRFFNDKFAKFIPFWNLKVPIKNKDNQFLIAYIKKNQMKKFHLDPKKAIFLGINGKNPIFVFSINDEINKFFENYSNIKYEDLRSISGLISNADASILAHGRAIIDWNEKNKFCGKCGFETTYNEGGNARKCSNENCNTLHFPRTDPVVIMLVHKEDKCILGRQSSFPNGFYSVLAGFMEPAESIEDAVRREVMEEISIKVGDVLYDSSQPWPYPSSLMIGCFAEAISSKITIDKKEISEALWVNKSTVQKAVRESSNKNFLDFNESNKIKSNLRIPPPMAIAYQLLKTWSEEN